MIKKTQNHNSVKAHLMDALVELGKKKPFLEINVKELCEKAGIHRSTFYRYYDSTDDVLRELNAVFFQFHDMICVKFLNVDFANYSTGKNQYKMVMEQLIDFILQMETPIFGINTNRGFASIIDRC